MPPSPRAILLLGMHRSGTSALTRTLALCGAGLPRTLFPPVPGDNDTGYWESSRVIDFHQALLWQLGTGYLDPALPWANWLRSAEGQRCVDDLAALIADEWGDQALWVIKEPRLCRLVPLWRAALAKLDRETIAVHCLREPAEVAASLAKRDGMPRDRAELLWGQHVAMAERDTREVPRIFLRFDALLENWEAVVARIAALLGDDSGLLDPAAGRRAVDEFLDPGRRHHRLPAEPPRLAAIRGLRDGLFAAIAAGTAPHPATIDGPWAAIAAASPAAMPRTVGDGLSGE